MPGVEYDQLHQAMQLADRVSVNLEGPTQERLSALAPKKDFIGELLKMLLGASQRQNTLPVPVSNQYRKYLTPFYTPELERMIACTVICSGSSCV